MVGTATISNIWVAEGFPSENCTMPQWTNGAETVQIWCGFLSSEFRGWRLNRKDAVETHESPAKQSTVAKERRKPCCGFPHGTVERM